MTTLTDRQQEIVDFIRQHVAEHGYAPTVREIGEAIGISSPNGVMDHLKALRRKGVADWAKGKARTIRLLVTE